MTQLSIEHDINVLATCDDCGRNIEVVYAVQDKNGNLVVRVGRCDCSEVSE